MAEERPKYRCTMSELYAIMDLGIKNLNTDLALFAAKSSNYNAALVTSLRTLRTNAMNLPDEEMRNAIHQTLGNQLPGLAEPLKQDFNDLKGLIRDAWPTEDPQPRIEAAGLNYYNRIGERNWENVESLHTAMNAFITDASNAAKLTLPGGMLPTFPTGVTAHYTAWNAVYPNFLSSRETATATAAKIKANNKLYETCMNGFMKFGVESVFRNDAEGQKRYTFDALKDIVSPPGSASMTVGAKRPDDTLVTDALVNIKKEGDPALIRNITPTELAVFLNLNPGDYTGYVEIGGVRTPFVKTVNTGTNARVIVEVG